MINDETVFVLGAGASAPYGYPTASELRDDICLYFKSDMNDLFRGSKGDYWQLADLVDAAANDFIDHFQKSRIRSIDRWLGLNGEYKDIGKLAIVNAIVKREQPNQLIFEGKGKSLDWFSVLFNEMLVGIAKPEHFQCHRVHFITFNYDRVFEHLFYESFRNTFSKVKDEEINRILSSVDIVHIYGCIDDPPWKGWRYKYGGCYRLKYLDDARKRIMTVDEIASSNGPAGMSKVDLLLKGAKNVFFLGFGYDRQNLDALRIPQCFQGRSEPPKIFGTGQGLLPQEIQSIEMEVAPGLTPTIKELDCTELLRRYFVGRV
jgi:hypothetical protein